MRLMKDSNADVLMIDNLATLCHPGENPNSTLYTDALNRFILQLRKKSPSSLSTTKEKAPPVARAARPRKPTSRWNAPNPPVLQTVPISSSASPKNEDSTVNPLRRLSPTCVMECGRFPKFLNPVAVEANRNHRRKNGSPRRFGFSTKAAT